jgi:hypothetical protein
MIALCELCAVVAVETPATEARFAHQAFTTTACRLVALCHTCATEGWPEPTDDEPCDLCAARQRSTI